MAAAQGNPKALQLRDDDKLTMANWPRWSSAIETIARVLKLWDMLQEDGARVVRPAGNGAEAKKWDEHQVSATSTLR